MKAKTKEDLSSLDEELFLFDDIDWSFTLDDSEEHEYYQGINSDFQSRSLVETIKYCIITLVLCTSVGIGGVFVYETYFKTSIDTGSHLNLLSDDELIIKRIDGGIEVSSDEFIGISKVISGYFGVLKTDVYSNLNKYCLKSSTFYETESMYREKMEYSFDKNDCYSRALRCFSEYFSVKRVKEILYKDDVYYAYVEINFPDNNSLLEYFYTYSVDMTKYFNSNDITDSNIVRYILQLSDTFGLPTSSTEVCIELSKVDNNYLLVDDSFLTSNCTSGYNYAVSQVVRLLGVNKAVNQYE